MKRIAVALFALLLSACPKSEVPEETPAVQVEASATNRLARVEPASSLGWLEAPARALAAPDASAVIGVPLSARVVSVRVRPGDRVEKGAPLVDVSMPELIRAAGVMSAAGMRLAAFEKRSERLAPLSKDGLVRSADLTELEAQIALAKADRESARATLRAAGLNDEQALRLLPKDGTLSLRSPISGVVVSVDARVGEMRDAASGPLVEVVSGAPTLIEARFFVPPAKGATLEWLESGRSVALEATAASPAALREDGTRVVWLRAKAAEDSPVANAVGRVRVVPRADWVVVPTRALIQRDGKTFVALPKGSGRREQPVTVVQQTTNEVVVTGLSVGAEVFVREEPKL